MPNIKLKPILLATTLLLLSFNAISAECSAATENKTTPLLELYTSEGCSSCPPADQWLSSLDVDKKRLTTLAFHVDYWDYIGWQDKFAKAKYSDRQRQIAKLNGARFIYTPQFVFNGRDFKKWGHQRLNIAIKETQQLPARAQLSLKAVHNADGSITLKAFADEIHAQNAVVYIALYENGLKTQVKAGENTGRTLVHDYVVRKLFGSYPLDSTAQFEKHFNLGAAWQNKDAGAVIFVQNTASGEIIQSLQLAFCHTS